MKQVFINLNEAFQLPILEKDVYLRFRAAR